MVAVMAGCRKSLVSFTCKDSILALQAVCIESGQSRVLAINSLLMSECGSS